MEIKKTKRASLEKSRSVFTLFGMILTLSLVWFTFEYKSYDVSAIEIMENHTLDSEPDVVIATEHLKPPPPPPIVPTTVIKIVKNTEKVKMDIDFTVETDEKALISLQIPEDDDEKIFTEDKIFVFLEKEPEYPGGDKARLKYLSKAIVYPEMAIEYETQGTVYLTFVVEKNGIITNVKVLRGIGGGCDEAAVSAIKRMPPWKPGKQRGRAVRAQFNMPVKFILE